MRLLIRPWPRIEITVGVEVAVIAGGAVLRPGLQDDLDRLFVPFACGRRVDRIGPIFHAGSERERHLQAALRKHVEHSVFFGQTIRIFEVRRRAPHADFGVLDLRNDHRGDQVWRRHHAVRRIVMFINDDCVKAEPIGKNELGDVLLVELMPAFGI